MTEIQYKRCSKCGQDFPATHEYFTRDPQKKDGLYSSCRNCYRKPAHREVLPEGFKRCTRCRCVKAVAEYSMLKRGGYDSWCRQCRAGEVKERYIPSPRTKLTKEELSQRRRERNRDYNRRNKEKRRMYHKEYYRKTSAMQKERVKVWQEDNPEKVKVHNKLRKARRRAVEASAVGSHSTEDIQRLYEEQEGRCAYCGITLHGEFHLDHVEPLVRGGSNDPDNLACACADCNLSKGGKTLDEWVEDRAW